MDSFGWSGGHHFGNQETMHSPVGAKTFLTKGIAALNPSNIQSSEYIIWGVTIATDVLFS